MTGVSECSQQRGNLKDDGYKLIEIYKLEVCNGKSAALLAFSFQFCPESRFCMHKRLFLVTACWIIGGYVTSFWHY
ncbi:MULTISPECIES: hypothetical protein [Photorhabdus]|uniref:hypothetical protein n=1 Tax=Photorhabdus TaxID=29487 RepID=UPI0003224C14|nr:hypothetical protein [Photorhabdus asymbiotica]